jgi:hypothetical protein
MSYQPLTKPRFEIRQDSSGEYIRIKARRQWFVLLFLPVWLTGWTIGGLAAMAQMAGHFSPFLALWLCGWVLGWAFAVTTLAWMIFGAETLRATNSDLEVGLAIGPWRRRRLYQGLQIRRLKASPSAYPFSNYRLNVPFMPGGQWGVVQFDYGARTVRFGGGLDEAEGVLIVQYIGARLPVTATAD